MSNNKKNNGKMGLNDYEEIIRKYLQNMDIDTGAGYSLQNILEATAFLVLKPTAMAKGYHYLDSDVRKFIAEMREFINNSTEYGDLDYTTKILRIIENSDNFSLVNYMLSVFNIYPSLHRGTILYNTSSQSPYEIIQALQSGEEYYFQLFTQFLANQGSTLFANQFPFTAVEQIPAIYTDRNRILNLSYSTLAVDKKQYDYWSVPQRDINYIITNNRTPIQVALIYAYIYFSYSMKHYHFALLSGGERIMAIKEEATKDYFLNLLEDETDRVKLFFKYFVPQIVFQEMNNFTTVRGETEHVVTNMIRALTALLPNVVNGVIVGLTPNPTGALVVAIPNPEFQNEYIQGLMAIDTEYTTQRSQAETNAAANAASKQTDLQFEVQKAISDLDYEQQKKMIEFIRELERYVMSNNDKQTIINQKLAEFAQEKTDLEVSLTEAYQQRISEAGETVKQTLAQRFESLQQLINPSIIQLQKRLLAIAAKANANQQQQANTSAIGAGAGPGSAAATTTSSSMPNVSMAVATTSSSRPTAPVVVATTSSSRPNVSASVTSSSRPNVSASVTSSSRPTASISASSAIGAGAGASSTSSSNQQTRSRSRSRQRLRITAPTAALSPTASTMSSSSAVGATGASSTSTSSTFKHGARLTEPYATSTTTSSSSTYRSRTPPRPSSSASGAGAGAGASSATSSSPRYSPKSPQYSARTPSPTGGKRKTKKNKKSKRKYTRKH